MLSFRFCRTPLICVLVLSLGCAAAARQTSESFQSLVQSANAARDSGNADEAIRDYSRAVALRPDWAEGWWGLGITQYEANQYADAVTSLRSLVALAPNMAPGWSILGLSEFETKDYASALASLEKAKQLGGIDDPDIARVSAFHLALLRIRNGEFERATELLHSIFGAPAPPQVRVALGLALLRIPLLPSEVDPSQEALIQAAGDAAASANIGQALAALTQQYPKTPWLHYAYGLALNAAGQTHEALAQQKLETGISDGSALPWIEISRLELSLMHWEPALNAARRAVVLDAESSAAHESLAKALSATGNVRQAAQETQQAERLSQSPSRRDPGMIALYRTHSAPALPEGSATWKDAMQSYSAGNYPETIADLKVWVERNPTDGTAWAVMGLSEFALKDYDNSRIHLQRGVDLGLKGNAESVQLATNRLALLLIQDGQFEAATALLTPMAGRPPMASQTQLELGMALLHMPSPLIDLDAPHRDLAQSAGAIVELLLASRYTEAFPLFQKLIAEYPATPWLHYAYGDALDSLSQYDDAKVQMRAELKLSPHNPQPWIRLASIALRQHLPTDALNAAQNAVAMSPESAEAHYELGRALLESGDAQKAITELQEANTIKPDSPEIHFALARAYTKANLPEKAAAERTAFMQLKAIASQRAQNSDKGQSVVKPNTQ